MTSKRQVRNAGRAALAALVAAGLTACGGSEPAPETVQETAASAQASETSEPARIVATAQMAEEAYRCRGLMSAAWAAVQVLDEGERPAALADLGMVDASVWNTRIGQLDTSAIPEADIDAMLVKGTKILATREALEGEIAAIEECRKAAAAF